MTINTKYARLLSATKHYIFLLPLASLFLLAACSGGSSNPSASASPSNLSIEDSSAFEGAGAIEFIVSLNTTSKSVTSFDYRTIPSSASASSDYTSVTKKTASIAAGNSATTIRVAIIDDKKVEDTESFIVEILQPSSNTVLDKARGTIEIDDLPSLAITGSSASEDAGSIKFTASLSEAFPGNIVSFDYRTIPSSASADLDYTSVVDTTSIQAGDTTSEIFIAIINDASIEGDEIFEVKISNPNNAIISKGLALGVIKGELPSLFIADATALESDSNIKFVVSLSRAISETLSFDYHTIAGSASATIDYTSVSSGRATIDIGDTTAEIFIHITNDEFIESDETFLVSINITNTNPLNVQISRDKAIGTIKIDDLPSLSIADATSLEDAGSIKFRVSLSEAFPDNIVSFNYRIIAGSASADLDYRHYPRTVSINVDDTTAELSVAIINDTLIENDETFDLVIINPVNATINKNRARATATIKIDELPIIAIADATTLEDAGSIKFLVSLSAPFPGNIVSFDYRTIPSSASAGSDYTSVSDTTSIQAGDTTAEIFIGIINDASAEGDEVFELKLSNPVNATISKGLAIGIIKGELVSLFVADATALESAKNIKFVVSLSQPQTETVSFDYRTIADSASATSDYTSVSSTATIDIGETRAEIFIELINDASVEDDEIFYLAISTNRLDIPITRGVATATIKIDDLPSLAIADAVASEDAGSIKFRVSLSEAFPGNIVSFDYQTIAGSASAHLDYTPFPRSVSINAGDTTAEILIELINDTLAEDDEIFYLAISNIIKATANITQSTATIKINDLSLFITDATAFENARHIKFTVSLSEPFPSDKIVPLNYRTIEIAGSASATIDYISASSTANIQSGDTTTEIFIELINDASVEDNESFYLEISTSQLDIPITRARAIGTIKIDDLPSLAIADAAASEDAGSIKFLVSLSEAFEGNLVAFNYHTIPSSANTQDYTSASSRATIDIGETSTEIVIDLSNDSLPEDAETFLVVISNPINATIDENRARATGTIKISDLSLSIADSSVKENVGSIKFTVSLSEPFPSNKLVAFNYRTQDTGSAIAGTDYTSVVAGRATIDIKDTTTEIVIDLSDDSLIEGDETFLVVISTNQLAIPITRKTATGTIKIDDLPSLAITGSSASEDAGTLTFSARLSEPFYGNLVSFDYQTKRGSANNKATLWQQVLANTATQSPNRWSQRNNFSSVVFQNKIWVLGGIERLFHFLNDVWSSPDGIHWVEATADAAWSKRFGLASVVYKGKMWVLGGVGKNDVWYSTDGINWDSATTDAAWSARQEHSSVVYKGKMWVLGGYDDNDKDKNDVWYSADGENWSEVTTNNIWSVRKSHSTVVFDGKIWVLGGYDDNDKDKNDVWYSTDGENWSEVTTNNIWSARLAHSSVVFDSKIWVLGGYDVIADKKDVWYSSNGADWDELTTSSSWSPRSTHNSVVFDNKMWVMGGTEAGRNDIHFAYATGDYLSASSTRTILGGERSTSIDIELANDDILELTDETFDIIISNLINATIDAISGDNKATSTILADTASWAEATADAGWEARSEHGSVVFDAQMWVLGGSDGSNKNDVWYSINGINWTSATTAAAWSARSFHGSVVFSGKIWVLGGSDNQGDKDDVWYSSNGADWSEVTTSNMWTARQNHSSVVFDNKIWVLGGNDGSNKKDVWYSSNGRDWTATADAAWSARRGHTSVVFGGKIWVLGGNDGDDTNDVWYSSNGANWSEVATSSIWDARSSHSSVVFDNKMWVLGGSDNQGDKKDVWYSSNGRNWIEVTTSSIWDARRRHSSVVFRDKIWVLGGKDSIANKNDVWFLSEQ